MSLFDLKTSLHWLFFMLFLNVSTLLKMEKEVHIVCCGVTLFMRNF